MKPMPDVRSFHPATELVATLIDACRDTQFAFEVSAGGVDDRLLRAELLQYSGQRREFIAELIAAARKLQDGFVDPGSICEPLQRNFHAIKRAIDRKDLGAVLRECESAESAAIEVYRSSLAQNALPTFQAILKTQLAAITRVRERIQRLRANARSDRN